jgi:hypothetical protein
MDQVRAARETAERAAEEMRGQLEAEQNSKRFAWRVVGDLRKQLGLMQRKAKSGGEAGADVAAPAAASATKSKQQRKRKPPESADE